MILEEKKTTVAYRCPKCGGGIMSAVGFFKLAADMVKLKCDCGESEMTVVQAKDSKVHFTVPCIFCPNPHQFTLNANVFFNKDLFSLACPYTGISIAMTGEVNKVKAELAHSELELLDLLEENGIQGFESLRGEQALSDPQIVEIILYVIKELDDEGRIRCKCEEGTGKEYELEFLPESVKISCKCCGASKEIFTQSLIAAQEFLNVDSIELE